MIREALEVYKREEVVAFSGTDHRPTSIIEAKYAVDTKKLYALDI